MSSYSDFANSASDILLKKGDALAQGKRASGEMWGGTIANLGQVIPQQVQEAMQQAAQRKKQAQIQQIIQQSGGDLERASTQIMGIDPKLGADLLKTHTEAKKSAFELQKLDWEYKKAKADAVDRMLGAVHDEDSYVQYALARKAIGDTQGLLDHYDPEWVKQQKIAHLSFKDQLELEKPKEPKPPESFTLSEGQTRFDAEGKPIANVPKAASESGFTLAPGGRRFDAQGNLIAESPAPAGGEAGFTLSPGQTRYGPDGKPIAARADRPERPASSGGGRPVTSGDANKLAEYANSLNDLRVLSGELQSAPDTTGPAAQAGAALPNFVTAWTGIGATAKAKQAVIDRVKQVIGKALEGGVLRKEDEVKYQKILPTIGDPPSVVNAKLNGLKVAIEARQQAQIDALTDAGYDVTRFVSRQSTAPAPTIPTAAAPKKNPFR